MLVYRECRILEGAGLSKLDKNRQKSPEFDVKQIPMDQLVPGELVLEKDVVECRKAAIHAGDEIELPRVVQIGLWYYVRDGNHRIMAMKLLGRSEVSCRIQPHNPPPGYADYDTDQCHEAVERGYLGFNRVKLGSKADKESAYDKEDDSFEDLT